jgi:hypothetical protein
MENPILYILKEKDISGSALAYSIDEKDTETRKLKFRFSDSFGNKYYDLIFQNVSSFLFSSKIINLLLENNITGWKAYPAVIYDKKSNIIDGYSLFEVTGKCSTIDWNKSEKFKKQFVPNAPFADMLRGIYPDLSTWDGSDIFMVEGKLFMFVTEKIKSIFTKNKITNVEVIKSTEFEMLKPLLQTNLQMEENANLFFK